MNEVSDNATATAAAQSAFEHYRVRPTTQVTYVSSGRLLVIGRAADIETQLSRLPLECPIALILSDRCPPVLEKKLADAGVRHIDRCTDISVGGYLGAFQVSVTRRGESLEANTLLNSAGAVVDLILDLGATSSHPASIPPVGYFAPGNDPDRIAAALSELAELRGEFDKPKFFAFQEDLCAHSRSGVDGCRKCLAVCATHAITSENGTIRIDPYLCQGCGDCTTVCPSGAINYAFPPRADSLNRIRLMLNAFADSGGTDPVMLIHDAGAGKAWLDTAYPSLPNNVIPFEVEALGAAGMDIWLSAIAYGAASVLLLVVDTLTPHTRQSLAADIAYARSILQGLGLHPSIGFTSPGELADHGASSLGTMSTVPAATFAGQDDKRTVVRLAVEHLASHASTVRAHTALPLGAPFGTLEVDPKRCTLCMACVTVCPASALADGNDRPRLRFIEANCVQCGLCANACPERAITLIPRYRYDSREAREAVVLHEESAFACIRCGKPFATPAMIRAITEKLRHHPMFQGRNSERLMMCEECRIKAMF